MGAESEMTPQCPDCGSDRLIRLVMMQAYECQRCGSFFQKPAEGIPEARF